MRSNVSFERVGDPAVNHLVVTNFTETILVPGLVRGDFTVALRNPRGVNVITSTPVSIAELLLSSGAGSGVYRTSFVPNSPGEWTLEIYHATYFPEGKHATHVAYDALYYITDDASVQRRFRVMDVGRNPVTTLGPADFTARLWNPAGAEVSASVPVTVRNLGGGTYQAAWTCDSSGKWVVQLIQATYAPAGLYDDLVYVGEDSGDGGDGLVEAICRLLGNDAALRARLETYEFTSGTPEPAIFTTAEFPENARFPAIIVQRSAGEDFGTKAYEGEDATVSVRLYGDREYDQSRLRRTAEIMRQVLNRAALTLTNGFSAFRVIAGSPVLIADEDGFPGYLVDVRALLLAQRSESGS